MSDLLKGIPVIDHHCHAIVDEKRQSDTEALLRVTSEAPVTYSAADLKERLAWQAVKVIVGRYTDGQCPSGESIPGLLAQQDYAAYCRTLFQDAGYQALLLDTGFAPESAASLKKIASLTGAQTYPIFRLEKVLEEEFERKKTFTDWWEAVISRVRTARESGYIGAKSIAAYRSGLQIHEVDIDTAKEAFQRWKHSGEKRLTEADLINFGVWHAAGDLARQALPLQFHTGYGDPDTDLRQGNPLLLRGFIEKYTPLGLSIVLLHCYPYHREAGYLASVYNHVFFDTSLIVPLGLSSARRVVAEALELAPYSRYLFASDAHTRPEMFALAAEVFRDAFEAHLNDTLVVRYTSREVREHWASLVCGMNARRLYLDEA
ncbi:amidohydrolase family protein [Sporolactobacillus pectinivorans]|uniref:amidohydrolase family protein n=1 Tax=Sporolactobacillus pectinivorans TaxID=1591408 RepID=UPI0012FE66F9|nr:amidohydrolase family protein [Sporolactobacillus pectinivorans]